MLREALPFLFDRYACQQHAFHEELRGLPPERREEANLHSNNNEF